MSKILMINSFLKTFKNIFLFLVITGIVFSNIPYNVLTGLISSYEKNSGIVDKIWQLEQRHDGDVVDKFISLRNISEKLKVQEAMAAAPTYVNKGAFASGTAALTVTVPASYADNDVFLLFVESANQAITTPSGWTVVPNSPQSTGTAALAGGVRLSVFYKVVTGVQSSVTVADSGDHTTAIIMGFRGVDTSAPINISAGSVSAATAAMSFPTVTTTVVDSFVILAAAMDTDAASTATVTSWANANLTGITERHDQTMASGVGGGLAIATGGKTTAGATGATTATGSTAVTHAYMTIALKPVPVPNSTTLSNFVSAEPGNTNIAPGSSAAVDSFGLATSAGTDSITGVTVGLAAGMGQYVQTVSITNDGDTTTYCSGAPVGDTATISGCAIPVSTINTQFKIKITADPHALMPAPPGGSYPVTAVVTAWTGTNATKTGTDTGSSTVTIDNTSPNSATSVSGSAGDNANNINWTTSSSADFDTTNGSVVLRWASGSAGADVPTEGSGSYVAGNTIGGATVACVTSSAASTAQSKTDGTGGSVGCTTTALTNGQPYTYKVFQLGINGNYDVGVLIGTFTPVQAPPTLSSYTNTTESVLNYAGSCTTCGARIGGGAGFRQSITITGTNFGTDPGVGNRSTASNNIKVGTHLIASANITAWSDTSITFLTDSAITGDTDTDWGTNFGGSTALTVTAASQVTVTGLNFYVFPQVTSISGGVAADLVREYDAGDSDGIITLNGTRFGSAIGSGSVSIVGSAGTTTSWSNTAITVQVPTAIADTTNTGQLIITQGTGSNGKTNTYLNTLRILPRITSMTPNSGIIGTAVTVNGNHLCQSGTCPGSFSAADKVTFTSGVVATVFTSWSATSIVTAVPTGAATGNVYVTSNTSYTSNNISFSVSASTTTIATGSDPAATTIAPGASATDVNTFTLQTNVGTESIGTVTVNLSTNSGLSLIAITDNANTVLGSTSSPATGSNIITVSGLTATTSQVTYKVRVAPLAHTAMPAPSGAAYTITAPVTAWSGSNTHTGSDTNINALTIDNLSPSNITAGSGASGDAKVTLTWTNPADGDFHSTVVLRRTTSVVIDVPVEGTTYVVGNTIGSSTVACVVATPTATCIDSGLINGTTYYYKIFTKDSRVNYGVTGVVPTGSPLTPNLTQTLTVGTVGTQSMNLNSGGTGQHIGGGATAAFTVQINTGTSNLSSVKISDTGTVAIANLTNSKLYYENATSPAACSYGGTESVVSGSAPVGETITFTLPNISIGLSANVTCLYFVSDISSSTVSGQTIDLQITNPSTDIVVSSGVNTDVVSKALTGTTTIRSLLTGYTNTTETALNYAASCASCGARIGGGAGFRQSITISGYGFGTVASGSRSTATNNIKVGTHQIADLNITAWTSSSITFLTDTAVAGDTDSDWGTNFGGASALTVTTTSVSTSGLNFYVFPQITSLSVPSGFPSDSVREYSAGDSDGIFTLNGTRFGGSMGSGSVTVLGTPASSTSWGNTAITGQVPVSISDSTYTGLVSIIQGTGGNSKQSNTSTMRILPRITSLTPTTAGTGEAITVNGNHFCQTGTCPGAFSGTNKVTFTSGVMGTVFTSWSHTAITTTVPVGAISGNIIATSNSYNSNGLNFDLASSLPSDPTSVGQFKDAALSEVIPLGAIVNSVPIYFTMTTSTAVSGGTLYPQIEYKQIGTPFVCTLASSCLDANEGAAVAGPGPVNLSQSITPTDGSYHYQVRVKHTKNSTDYYSAWVSFGGNAETDADFILDRTPPEISNVSSGSPGTNNATITWETLGELSTSQVQWNTTGTFDANCATNNDCTIIKNVSPMVNSHSVALSNLNSGTLYYFRVRSKDSSGNEIIDSNNSFTTQQENHPAKTVKNFINGAEGSINSATTYYFTEDVPETDPNIQNAFIEVLGLVSAGFSGTVTVDANSVGAKAYEVSAASGTPTLYKFIYSIDNPDIETNLNLNDEAPCTNGPGGGATCNKVTLTPTGGDINVMSAKIISTYSYTP